MNQVIAVMVRYPRNSGPIFNPVEVKLSVMSRGKLRTASEELELASTVVPDAELTKRLVDHSSQLGQLATTERGPDHGRLARHERSLSEIKESVDVATGEHIDAALDHIRAYREAVEGV